MQNVFLTADTHFDHRNIIKYCNRDFNSVEEMNQTIIDNWNNVVKKNDIIYHLGDFAFNNHLKFIKQLNGKKHLILGNHDEMSKFLHQYFTSVQQYKVLKFVEPNITLFHYALRVWHKSHFGAYHAYGHSHGTLPSIGKSHDVGVDTNNFKPYALEDLNEIFRNKQININMVD